MVSAWRDSIGVDLKAQQANLKASRHTVSRDDRVLLLAEQGGLIYGQGIQDENMTLKEAKYDTISSSENGERGRGFSDFFFKKRFFILFFR